MVIAIKAVRCNLHEVSECEFRSLLQFDGQRANSPEHESIIMIAMFRVALFVLVLLLSTFAIAHTPPPGAPYDASKHPNPIVTFVEEKDFKPVKYDEAKKSAGIELLG